MQNLLGAEYASFSACYGQAPESGLRVNTLKISPEEFCASAAGTSIPSPGARRLITSRQDCTRENTPTTPQGCITCRTPPPCWRRKR